MNQPHSDALVFFGGTGVLAYKKIFPALQAMLQRGILDAPVIGINEPVEIAWGHSPRAEEMDVCERLFGDPTPSDHKMK